MLNELNYVLGTLFMSLYRLKSPFDLGSTFWITCCFRARSRLSIGLDVLFAFASIGTFLVSPEIVACLFLLSTVQNFCSQASPSSLPRALREPLVRAFTSWLTFSSGLASIVVFKLVDFWPDMV